MGTVDIYHTRRTMYSPCLYWLRDERTSIAQLNQLVYQEKPAGKFYAKPLAPQYNRENIINGVWLTDSNTITITTEDYIDDIKRGCIIKYNHKLWLVTDVQKKEHMRENMLSEKLEYNYTINMRCQ